MRIECSGCDHVLAHDEQPFRCPQAKPNDNIDHVLVRKLSELRPALAAEHPFIRYRERLWAFKLLERSKGADAVAIWTTLVEELDAEIRNVDGRGFVTTPMFRAPALAAELGLGVASLTLKSEIDAVGGSHKARHLMGLMLYLRCLELTGVFDQSQRRPLAIASCGNAALAAAVIARAAGWPLRVFVPEDASASVLERLGKLEAEINVCARDDQAGDPCYRAFLAAVAEGAHPFCCQGSDCGLTIEGGQTLAYELIDWLAETNASVDALVIQVGGGAFASACAHAFAEAHSAGMIAQQPALYTVQTQGAHPLQRSYEKFVALVNQTDAAEAWQHARQHRDQYMWPWETPPKSIAHGILDDETYDWFALVEAMQQTGGQALVVDDATIARTTEAVRNVLKLNVSHTGAAGLAGIVSAAKQLDGKHVAAVLSGVNRHT